MTRSETQALMVTIDQMEPQFKAALPAHVSSKKFIRAAKTALQQNPNLMTADRQSLFLACQRAAQDGLIIDGREAAIVMFKDQAQYMPMLAGILKKLRNTGEISTITAQCVYENDGFSYDPASGAKPMHDVDWFKPRGKLLGVYALATLKDGSFQCEVMNKDQIEKVRNVSRAKSRGPWVDWYEEMACKTVLRRLAKFLPQSSDVDSVISADDEWYELNQARSSESSAGEHPSEGPSEPAQETRAAGVVKGRGKAKAAQAAAPAEESGEVIEDASYEEVPAEAESDEEDLI